MPILKPFKRTCRQFVDGDYTGSGHWRYLLHKDYAQDPQHYIRGFLLIQEDLINLFKYVEPCDQNLQTVSLRIHELLVRTCIELEANFTAILRENIYSKDADDLNMRDYSLINITHRISSYEVKFPIWKGNQNMISPFKAWERGDTLTWYRAFNKTKHDRHENFYKATLENLIYAIAGLVVLLSAQFLDEDYSPNVKGMGIGASYSYGWEEGINMAVGGYFKVRFPNDWPNSDRYDFFWGDLVKDPYPIGQINYNNIQSTVRQTI